MNTNTKGFICKTCGHRGATNNGTPACSYHRCLINPETDFCSWHINQDIKDACPVCGTPQKANDLTVYITDKGEITYVCKNCLQYMGVCQTCIHQSDCGLMNDKTEPPYIMKVVRQGMMTMQTQVKNPKLVVKHCQKCVCSDGTDPSIKDVTCFKEQNGTLCSNWQILPVLLQ